MSEGYKNEAEGYAASLRQQAQWSSNCDVPQEVDTDELLAAAAFIERQQAEIDALKHDVERHLAIVSAELSSDARYLHDR